MTRYLLSNDALVTELWAAVETNPAYSQDLTTRATVAKNPAGTYFKYRPSVTVTATGNFPDIALAKSGWRLSAYRLINLLQNDDKVLGIGVGWVRQSQKVTLNATINKIQFFLKKYGTPTGSISACIRKVSDDSIIATSTTSLDASSLTTTYAWYDFAFDDVAVNEEVRLTVEFSGGNITNYVLVGYQSTDVISGCISGYSSGAWTDWTTNDTTIQVYAPSEFNGSFAAGNWTFKVALYNQTKYGHAVKIAARLSRSINANGSNATLIGAVTESPNTITLAGTAGDIKTNTWTYNLGAVTLTNEYLFVEFRCVIVTPATNASAQHSFICDENPATRDESVTPTTFTPAGAGPTPGWNKLQYLTEPPTAGAFNKLKFASEPPIPGSWNKILYSTE